MRADGALAVRTSLPPLSARQVERLPPGLQAEHARVSVTFAELRARRAAASRVSAEPAGNLSTVRRVRASVAVLET